MQRNILKKILICGVSLLLIFAPINSLYAAEDTLESNINLDESILGTYYVNAQHGLKMRSAPSVDADVVTLLPYQTELTVLGAATDSWYKAECSGKSGYVAAKYLTKSSATDTDTEAGDAKTTETQENTLPAEENATDTIGAAAIITALIAAIIIMAILAIYTAYSFLKKGNDGEAEEYGDEYDNAKEYLNEPEYNDNSEYDDGESIE